MSTNLTTEGAPTAHNVTAASNVTATIPPSHSITHPGGTKIEYDHQPEWHVPCPPTTPELKYRTDKDDFIMWVIITGAIFGLVLVMLAVNVYVFNGARLKRMCYATCVVDDDFRGSTSTSGESGGGGTGGRKTFPHMMGGRSNA